MDHTDVTHHLPQPRQPREDTESTTAAGDRLLARIQELRYLSARVQEGYVVGPHGQNLTVAEACTRAAHLDDDIQMDQVRGSLRHRRVNRLTRVLTLLTVTVVDFPIMLWLATSVFNVDWAAPLGLPLVISIVISVLATGGAASALHHLGHNQRQHKNDQRQLNWTSLTAGAKLSLVTVGLLVGLMGVLMFVRISTEGLLSGADDLAVLMAVLVALVMVVSATLVFWTAFRDGSLQQDDLRHYSKCVRPHLAAKRAYEDQAHELGCQYDLRRRRTARDHAIGGSG
jgi:hypothetical protein